MIRAITRVRRRAARRQAQRPLAAEIGALFYDFLKALFDPYRPELHYMRGPGPRWRAKHASSLPAASAAVPTPLPTRAPTPIAVPVLIRGS
jgi:hypothetical protein